MAEFIHMGGYAAYVWSAYAISMVVLVASLLSPMLQNKKLRRRIYQIHQEQE